MGVLVLGFSYAASCMTEVQTCWFAALVARSWPLRVCHYLATHLYRVTPVEIMIMSEVEVQQKEARLRAVLRFAFEQGDDELQAAATQALLALKRSSVDRERHHEFDRWKFA